MRNRITALLAGVAILLGLGLAAGTPASASAWEGTGFSAQTAASLEAQGFTVKTPAEWNAIKTVGILPASPSALAKRAPVDCPNTDKFCLWNGYNWTGTRWDLPSSWLQDSDGVNDLNGLSFYGSGINNASKGWYNRTGLYARIYDNDSCQASGWYRDMAAGNVAVSYDASTNDWENRVSSVGRRDLNNYCTNVPGV